MQSIFTVSERFPLEIEGIFYPTYYWYVEVEVQIPKYKSQRAKIILECPEQNIVESFDTIHAMNTYAQKKIIDHDSYI